MEYAQDYRIIRGNNVNNVAWVGSDEWGEQTVEQKEAVMQRKGAPLVKVGAQEEQQEEGGLGAFFTSLVDGASALIDGAVAVISEPVEALVPAILGAALLPVLGPIVAVPAAVGAAALMTAIGDAAKTTGIREETVEKLVKPLREEQLDGSEPQSEDAEEQFEESELQDEDLKQQFMEANLDRVIREVLSKDRQANEDLKQFFTRLVPDIQKAIKVAEKARETNIKIEGPVQGLIVGEHNDITQTFRGLLSGEN